jgi:glyoxylase-like metal-dependent hydrolase (beta-lactamase superfamily II)
MLDEGVQTDEGVQEVTAGIWRVSDTCAVYVVVAPVGADGRRTAIAIDFGSGRVLDCLALLGVDAITDVLMTHHHRDQAQGLPRAVAAGIAVHVPPVEQDLFADVAELWRTRPLVRDYNLRQDRFSLLDSVPVTSLVPEYRRHSYGGVEVEVVPTPGHSTGSVTYLVERGGCTYACTGDLIYAPGKVWSLAATQWSYTDNEGPAWTVLSCYLLAGRRLDLLLPSHGEPIADPTDALELLAERMQRYVDSRRTRRWDLRTRLEHPYRRLLPHLLLNTSSNCCSYVLLSDSGAALFVDFGYDMGTGNDVTGADRAARRPWLASLPGLRRDFGVTSIDAVLATHHHDDHVAGMNLLRAVEGTEVWAPGSVAEVLEDPDRFDLPCRWHDPVPVDRRLEPGETIRWREHEITVHDFPGHTRAAAAYEISVDGVTVLATGDQQQGQGIRGVQQEVLNYQYRNGFRPADYQASAALYRRVRPTLLLSGHWGARRVDEELLELLATAGDTVVELHDQLLPDGLDVGPDGILARIEPYRRVLDAGSRAHWSVQVRNPYDSGRRAWVELVLPTDWPSAATARQLDLGPGASAVVEFEVGVGERPGTRIRIAADVTIGDLRLGQHAEALVEVRGRP